MTTAELRQRLYEEGYPPQFPVDSQTYANACQEVFNHLNQECENMGVIEVWVGSHNGLMFKNTELIYRG